MSLIHRVRWEGEREEKEGEQVSPETLMSFVKLLSPWNAGHQITVGGGPGLSELDRRGGWEREGGAGMIAVRCQGRDSPAESRARE